VCVCVCVCVCFAYTAVLRAHCLVPMAVNDRRLAEAHGLKLVSAWNLQEFYEGVFGCLYIAVASAFSGLAWPGPPSTTEHRFLFEAELTALGIHAKKPYLPPNMPEMDCLSKACLSA